MVSLSNEAYSTLKSMKIENESFSDVILKITKKSKDIRKFFGTWKNNKELLDNLNIIEKERKNFKFREVKI